MTRRTEEDDRLVEDSRPNSGQEDRVYATELHVHLEAQIGERLWRRLDYVLCLNARCPYMPSPLSNICANLHALRCYA